MVRSTEETHRHNTLSRSLSLSVYIHTHTHTPLALALSAIINNGTNLKGSVGLILAKMSAMRVSILGDDMVIVTAEYGTRVTADPG